MRSQEALIQEGSGDREVRVGRNSQSLDMILNRTTTKAAYC